MFFKSFWKRRPRDYYPDTSFETLCETWKIIEAIYHTFPSSSIIEFSMMQSPGPKQWLRDHAEPRRRRYGVAKFSDLKEYRLGDIDCRQFVEFLKNEPHDEWFVHLFVSDSAHSLVTIFDWAVPPNRVSVNSVIGEERLRRFREALEF